MSSSNLVSLRLLKEANQEAFGEIAKEETRFLASAMAIVKMDPLIRMKLGGDKLTASVNLARMLRERAEKKHFNDRIDGAVQKLIDYELGTYGEAFQQLKESELPFTVEDIKEGEVVKGKKLKIDMKKSRGNYKLAFV